MEPAIWVSSSSPAAHDRRRKLNGNVLISSQLKSEWKEDESKEDDIGKDPTILIKGLSPTLVLQPLPWFNFHPSSLITAWFNWVPHLL
jgi:hypothetical protein